MLSLARLSISLPCSDNLVVQQTQGNQFGGRSHSWTPAASHEILNIEDTLAALDNTIHVQSIPDYLPILQWCREKRKLTYADRLYLHLCSLGLETNSALENYLVPMFVECGSIADSQKAFNKLNEPNGYSWNFLIQGYHEMGEFRHVLDLFDRMQQSTVKPSKYTYVALLKACARTLSIEEGWNLHAEVSINGYDEHLCVGTTLVDLYAKCGMLAEAQDLFDDLPVFDVVVWTALIDGYIEYGFSEKALCCFDVMLTRDICPNKVTFMCILKACGSVNDVNRGRVLHTELIWKGFETDPFVVNALVDMYAKCGLHETARHLLEKMASTDVVSWNALIIGFVECGDCDEAYHCLTEMRQLGIVPFDDVTFVASLKVSGCLQALGMGQELHAEVIRKGFDDNPIVCNALIDMYAQCCFFLDAKKLFEGISLGDVVPWNTLIRGFSDHEHERESLNLLDQMQSNGISPNAMTFASGLKGCSSLETLGSGQSLHIDIIKVGLDRDSLLQNNLIDLYAKCGLIQESRDVFNKHQTPDVVTWNSLIAGYADLELSQEALVSLENMLAQGFPANEITFICILKACKDLDIIDGQRVHAMVVKQGYDVKSQVANSLVDIYANHGLFFDAVKILNGQIKRDVVSWNVLMAGFLKYGFDNDVLNCLELMKWQGLAPHGVSLVLGLKACSLINSLEAGRKLHIEITKRGLEVRPTVHNTILDTYAKCGALTDAHSTFDKQTYHDVVSWTALIAGYASCGYYKEALIFLEKMQVEGMSPNAITLGCALKACLIIDEGMLLHALAIKAGYDSHILVGNTLLDMYARCGCIGHAEAVFHGIQDRDIVSWNTLISWYVKQGMLKEGWVSYENMQSQGVAPNEITYMICLQVCSMMGSIEKGLKLHMRIVLAGWEVDTNLARSVAYLYMKCGFFAESWHVSNNVHEARKNAISWSALISGYQECGFFE